MEISGRAAQLTPSLTLSIDAKAKAMKAEGIDVCGFGAGEPDFDTPEHIKQAAISALQSGFTKYTPSSGIPELRQAIAAKLDKENHLKVNPDREIIVTVGDNEAILMAMLGLLNPGDEVLIPDPMWLHYFYCARLAGAQVVSVPLRAADGFQLSLCRFDDVPVGPARGCRAVRVASWVWAKAVGA